jgi:hypothetical protein
MCTNFAGKTLRMDASVGLYLSSILRPGTTLLVGTLGS